LISFLTECFSLSYPRQSCEKLFQYFYELSYGYHESQTGYESQIGYDDDDENDNLLASP
jgi:hypothetical protein